MIISIIDRNTDEFYHAQIEPNYWFPHVPEVFNSMHLHVSCVRIF